MMNVDVSIYYDAISEHYDEQKQQQLFNIFDALQFKLKRNTYHFSNINKILGNATNLENNDYYNDIYMPIYYEIEGFLVSIRSSVDMLLHLANYTFQFNIPNHEVTLASIYHHNHLPKMVKNIFDRYTRPYRNPTWNFIYTFRNEIVHEKSVPQVLPINIDPFVTDQPSIYFSMDNSDKELISFFSNCLRFLETFTVQLLSSIEVSLKK
jgi:hypothetical protein